MKRQIIFASTLALTVFQVAVMNAAQYADQYYGDSENRAYENGSPRMIKEKLIDDPGNEYAWIPPHWEWQDQWVWIKGHWQLRQRRTNVVDEGYWSRHHHNWVSRDGQWVDIPKDD